MGLFSVAQNNYHVALGSNIRQVSALYYAHVGRLRPLQQRYSPTNARFATMMQALDLPQRPAHDALSDAIMAALLSVKLRALAG